MSGAELAVLTARFEGVARKMANTLHRTGRSGILTIARDFSCIVLTARHELVTAADSLPIHVLRGPDVMSRTMTAESSSAATRRRLPAQLALSRLHPSGRPQHPRSGHRRRRRASIHGARQGASGRLRQRVADDLHGRGQGRLRGRRADLSRRSGSSRTISTRWTSCGCARCASACPSNGGATISRRSAPRGSASAKSCRSAAKSAGRGSRPTCANGSTTAKSACARRFDRCPRERLTRSSRHDPFPGTPSDGVEIKVTVDVDPEAALIDIDVTDNPDCFENGLNLSEACARSAPMVGVFNSIDPTVPKNEGSFRRIRVKLRENCAVGIPRHPTSCSVATTNLADRVANPVQCAFAELADGLGLAEAGACIPASSGVISGVHDGRPFVNEVYLGCTGGAGAPTTDGWLTIMHVGNAGMCYQDSIEVDELRHPILVHARRLIPDSEGAGRFRGALGAYSEFSPRDCAMTVAYVSDGDLNPAKGVRGGHAGAPSAQFLKRR